MTIKAQDVKELREKTGLGMMECKKALEEANGNLEEAIKNLRKSSALKAEKKASRTAVAVSYTHLTLPTMIGV